jgi:hypothetical protein
LSIRVATPVRTGVCAHVRRAASDYGAGRCDRSTRGSLDAVRE